MSALTGFRIVELAESVAGEYCGKLLADFGAEVIKIERPDCGSPTRAMAPMVGDDSALFAYLNTNKRSVQLDVTSANDAEMLHKLIGTADAVIDDHPQSQTRTSPPGRGVLLDHPVRLPSAAGIPERQESQRLPQQRMGLSHSQPCRPRRTPVEGTRPLPRRLRSGARRGAVRSVVAVLAFAHWAAASSSTYLQQAVLASRADCILGRFITGEVAPQNNRDDYDQQGPASFFPCADGFVYLYITSRNHWTGIKKLMGSPEWLDAFDDDWLEFSVTPQKVATFQNGFAEWVRGLRKDTAAEAAQRLGVPLVPVRDAADLKNSPQYRHRGFFQNVTHPVLGAAAYPGVPYLLSASPARITSAAPTLGQHTTEVLHSIDTPRQRPMVKSPQLKATSVSRGGPLAGVRVVELTKVWAGPYTGKLLAFLGAEVIKIENAGNPDEMRAYGGTDINHAPYFLSINSEVLSVEWDLKSPDGMGRLRDLISRSDIVLNNLRPGAMERLGLGYEDLKTIKPDIISVSIKMWGNDGPLGYQTGYAPCFAALAGLASLVGYPGGPPLGASMRYGDSTVGAAAAFAAVAALLHRDLTGEGQFVDVSAVETLSSMIGDCLLEQDLTGKQLRPDGNRHSDMAPHNCYPCSDGAWISVAVADDTQWRLLCEVLGATALADDARYASLPERLEHTEALDVSLAELTANHDAGQLAQRLRSAGVPASKSATALDVISDQLLWDRELFRFVTDHREGQRPIVAAPWRMSAASAQIAHGAPDLGEHNDYVLHEILGAASRAMEAT